MAAEPASDNRSVPATPGVGQTDAGVTRLSLGKWLSTQLVAAGMLAVLLGPLGVRAAYSSLLGSLAAFVPAVLFAAYAGRKIGASSDEFLRAAVVGETLKLALTAVICTVVFSQVKTLEPGWFFAGMILVMVAGWWGFVRALNSGT